MLPTLLRTSVTTLALVATAAGQFGPAQTLDSVPVPSLTALDIDAADLDFDGDVDLAVSWGGTRSLVHYESLGGGSFAAPVNFPVQAVSANGAVTVDADQDGDLDVIALLSFFPSIEQLVQFENLGSNSFALSTLFPSGGFTGGALQALDLGNLTADGLPDVVMSTWISGRIVIKPGAAGGFAPGSLESTSPPARDVIAADLDGDGDDDVLLRSALPDLIAWYENLNGQGALGPAQAIDSPAQALVDMVVGDLDGDGDLDIVRTESSAVTTDTVLWIENLGGGVFAAPAAATSDGLEATAVTLADLDQDGNLDLVRGEVTGVSWFAGDGLGGFGPRQVITNTTDPCTAVATADLDGDGLPDVVIGTESMVAPLSELLWFENQAPVPWEALGSGLAGTHGVPTLWGQGSLVVGTPGVLTLEDALPSVLSTFVVSFSSTPVAFQCGILVPAGPYNNVQFHLTDADGRVALPWAAWPPGFSGLSLFMQVLVEDHLAPCQTAHSNALRADAP